MSEALRQALKVIDKHSISAIRTNSKDCGDWAEDMAYVGKVAREALAQPPAPTAQPAESTTGQPLRSICWANCPCRKTAQPVQQPTAQPAAPFLFIAMDDDKRASVTWCANAAAVREAAKRSMFWLKPGEELSAEHANELDGCVEELLDSGVMNFEGDPPLYLYRIGRVAQPVQQPGAEFDHSIGADRFTVHRGSFWWHVRIGGSTSNVGKFHTKLAAEDMALKMLTAYSDGAFEQYQAARAHAAPAQRQPLRDEEIEAIWKAHVLPGFGERQRFYSPVVYARAIESAHGIAAQKGEKL